MLMLQGHARILPNRLLNAGQMEINYFQLRFIKHVIQNGQKRFFIACLFSQQELQERNCFTVLPQTAHNWQPATKRYFNKYKLSTPKLLKLQTANLKTAKFYY